LALEDQVVGLHYPEGLHYEIGTLFRGGTRSHKAPLQNIVVQEDTRLDRFNLLRDGTTRARELDKGECLLFLLGEILQTLVTDLRSGVALHSGAVLWGEQGILIAGASGVGKSCLSAWLLSRGFHYLTDELVVLRSKVPRFAALRRPLIGKDGGKHIASLNKVMDADTISAGANVLISPKSQPSSNRSYDCRLIVFPRFEAGIMAVLIN
jgi:hypothetical protein